MKGQRTILAGGRCAFLVMCLQFSTAIAEAQQVSDPRVADIVLTGKLRVGIGLANLGPVFS